MKGFGEFCMACVSKSCHCFLLPIRVALSRVNTFCLHLIYFIVLSLVGFMALKASVPGKASFVAKGLDLFFTSVSATTVASMSTVEMEVFSNLQLVILSVLMLLGGEVFTSMLHLQLIRLKMKKKGQVQNNRIRTNSAISLSELSFELGLFDNLPDYKFEIVTQSLDNEALRFKSTRTLSYVVSAYLVLVLVTGSVLVRLYLALVPSAKLVLNQKRLNLQTFAVFTTISTFANCGFIPTNENMVVFKKNSGLLLILIPLVLMGNTLYPICLRSFIWILEKVTKRSELKYMLENSSVLEYGHFLPGLYCAYLAVTVLGFILLQLMMFLSLEWHSQVTAGLSAYQKFVGSLFQVVNSRYTGESVFDLSAVSSAMMVLFIVMMYLPPYTSYLPIKDSTEERKMRRQRNNYVEHALCSQLTYLVIFIILICITEREKIKSDPLNFNVLNIVFEVISAYGTVGFSTGYSCARKLNHNSYCKDASYGFVGKWSNEGKFILILVMFLGRMKKFNMKGGRAWCLQ